MKVSSANSAPNEVHPVLPEGANIFSRKVARSGHISFEGRPYFISKALAGRYDLVFVSNSLQYARDWQALLGRLAEAGVGWLFLSHVPLVEAAPAYVVAQRPSWVGYETEYLSWVFNRAELLSAAAAAGLVLEREFLMVGETYEIAGAPEQCDNGGFLFRIGRQ